MSRRDFMEKAASQAKTLPTIRLGKVEVSRLILGSNPFFGFGHQTPALDEEMKAYFTDERIVSVLDAAAAEGITAVAAPPYPRWISLFDSYLSGGGKIGTWIAQPDGPADSLQDEITAAVKGHAAAVFVQGARTDEQFVRRKHGALRGWLEHIRSLGVPAGLASHRPDVHLTAEKLGWPSDFYFQCFFNPLEGYNQADRDRAVAALAKIDKPVVGYKVLGAGRLGAPEALAFALGHLRPKDGVCIGMFPKHQPKQIAENADLVRRLTKAGAAPKAGRR